MTQSVGELTSRARRAGSKGGGHPVSRRALCAYRVHNARAAVMLALAVATSLVAPLATSLAAQRPVPVGVVRPPIVTDTVVNGSIVSDSLQRPPLSPRRALIYSLILPGFAQSRLDRPTASILFAVGEVLSIGMARKAAMDLREARAALSDSIPTGFSADTTTGIITPTGFVQNTLVARIGARRTHYEDWIAAIIFNHIISAADAYVAANLWDFNANVSVAPTPNGAAVAASIRLR